LHAIGHYTYGWLLQILWLILTTAASIITACRCDYCDYYGYYSSLFVTMVTARDWLLLLRPRWLLLVTAATVVSSGYRSYHSLLWLLHMTGYVGYCGCYRYSYYLVLITIFVLEESYPCNRPWRSIICETLRVPVYLDNRLTDGGEVISLRSRPPFTLRKIPGTQFR
jgi:hypothetical protein